MIKMLQKVVLALLLVPLAGIFIASLTGRASAQSIYISDTNVNETVQAWVGSAANPGSGYLLSAAEGAEGGTGSWMPFTLNVTNWGGLSGFAPANDQVFLVTLNGPLTGGDEGPGVASDYLLAVGRAHNPVLQFYFSSTPLPTSLPPGLPIVAIQNLSFNETGTYQNVLGYSWGALNGSFGSPLGTDQMKFYIVSDIPEPSTLVLAGLGVAALAFRTRRRRTL
jgi:hypothetical protein